MDTQITEHWVKALRCRNSDQAQVCVDIWVFISMPNVAGYNSEKNISQCASPHPSATRNQRSCFIVLALTIAMNSYQPQMVVTDACDVIFVVFEGPGVHLSQDWSLQATPITRGVWVSPPKKKGSFPMNNGELNSWMSTTIELDIRISPGSSDFLWLYKGQSGLLDVWNIPWGNIYGVYGANLVVAGCWWLYQPLRLYRKNTGTKTKDVELDIVLAVFL